MVARSSELVTTKRTAGDVLRYETPGRYCREEVKVPGSAAMELGLILGKRRIATTPAATGVAMNGNTGNGVFTKDATTPVLAGAKPGVYLVRCIRAVSDAGDFDVTDPDGDLIGTYSVGGPAFARSIKFTIADGSANFVVGDTFRVTVTKGDEVYVPVAQPGTVTDGSDQVAAVLIREVRPQPAGITVQNTVVVARGPAIVADFELRFPSWVTLDADRSLLLAGLLALGIKPDRTA